MNREEALSDIVNREHFYWPRRTGPTPRVPGEGWVWVGGGTSRNISYEGVCLYHIKHGTITREDWESRKP